MSRHIIKSSKPRPTTLIKIDSIDIDSNNSFDKLIICASKFEDSLKKTGATTDEYTIIDLFNLALQATKIDTIDEVKRAIGEAIIEEREGYRREYRRVDQREKQVSRGYFKNNYI